MGSYYKNEIFNCTRLRKYGKGRGFLPFTRKFGNKYGKTIMDTATKSGIGAETTASKRIVQKTAEATGDLIQNKIADKITSKRRPKEKETNKSRRNLYSTRKKTTNY